VRVVRVPSLAPGRSDAMRLLDYAAVGAGSALRWIASRGRFDAVLATLPPLTAGLAGLWAARAAGAPLVLDARDLWPEEPFRAGLLRRDSAAGRIAQGIARHVTPRAAAWIAASRGIAEGLAALGADPARTAVVRNGPERALLGIEPLPPPGDSVAVLYAGLLGRAQGLGSVLRAAGLLAGEGRIRFRLVGAGVERAALEEEARSRRLPNVSFEGPHPPGRIVEIARSASVLLAPLRRGLRATIPAKMLEGMALARPVLLAGEGEAAEILREAGAGVVVPPEDPEALAAALRDRLARPEEWEEMGRRGREYMRRFEGREEAAARVAALVRQAVERTAGRAAAGGAA